MKSQRGTTLIELMLALSLISVIAISSFSGRSNDVDLAMSKALGSRLLEYNTAVQSYISTNPNITFPATRVGSAWLKHTSCPGGSSNHHYLPCNFPEFVDHSVSDFGKVTLTTTLTKVTVGGEQVIRANTETTPIHHNHVQRSDLAGIAAIVAASGRSITDSPALITTKGTYGSDPSTAKITMVASSTPLHDMWLRTDGANTMKANITFESGTTQSQREIQNVSLLQSHGSEKLLVQSESANSDISVETGRVGYKSGTSLFDINPTTVTNTVGSASVTVGSGKVVNKSGSAEVDISSSQVLRKHGATTSSEVYANRILNRSGSVSTEINATRVSTTGDQQIRKIASVGIGGNVDFDSLLYNVDPVFRNVRASLGGNLVVNQGMIIMSGGSLYNGGHITTEGTITSNGDIHAPGWGSTVQHPNHAGNSVWRVEPADHSQLNNVNIKGRFTIHTRDTAGAYCNPSGSTGTTVAGDLLSCFNNRWYKVMTE